MHGLFAAKPLVAWDNTRQKKASAFRRLCYARAARRIRRVAPHKKDFRQSNENNRIIKSMKTYHCIGAANENELTLRW